MARLLLFDFKDVEITTKQRDLLQKLACEADAQVSGGVSVDHTVSHTIRIETVLR